MDRKRLVSNLKDLFNRVEACADPDCSVCKGIEDQIERVADDLEFTSDEREQIIPLFVRMRRQKREKQNG